MSQQVNSPFFVRQVAEYVAGRIGRRLKLNELSWLRNFIEEHVPQRLYLSNIQLAQWAKRVGDEVARLVATHSQQREVVDVHQMLTDVMATDGKGPMPFQEDVPEAFDEGRGEAFDEGRDEAFDERGAGPVNKRRTASSVVLEQFMDVGQSEFSIARSPASLYGVKHILLDSKNRENYTNTENARWAAYSDGVPPDGSFGYEGDLQNIVAARIYAFYTPVSIEGNAFTIGIGFEEFADQAFLGQDGVRFNFVMNPVESLIPFGERYKLNPFNNNRGLFQFYKPITRLSSLTMRMYEVSDSSQLQIVQDKYNVQVILTAPNILLVTDTQFQTFANFVVSGDVVVLQDYTPPASVLNSPEITQLLNPGGVTIISVGVAPNTRIFEVDVPSPAAAPANENFSQMSVIRFGYKIPIDVVYRRPESDFVL